MPPSWNFPSDRTTLDSTIVADENAILAILQLLGGNGTSQPTSSIEALKALIDAAEVRSTVKKTANYVILDDDGYTRIECDTTAGDMTITLPTKDDNLRRQIEIAVIAGANKVIIAPDSADASTLSNDGLAAMWLPKIGDLIKFQESADSGKWDIISERITSSLYLTSYAGYGSTDTKIMRFTTAVVNIGNMFGENHSTGYASNADGLEITANRSGRYSFNYTSIGPAAGSLNIGISLNSNQLTTNIETITEAHKLTITYIPATLCYSTTIVKYLNKGDVLRPHCDGAVPTSAGFSKVLVEYLG